MQIVGEESVFFFFLSCSSFSLSVSIFGECKLLDQRVIFFFSHCKCAAVYVEAKLETKVLRICM